MKNIVTIERFKKAILAAEKSRDPNIFTEAFSIAERKEIFESELLYFDGVENSFTYEQFQEIMYFWLMNSLSETELNSLESNIDELDEVLGLFFACSTNNIELKKRIINKEDDLEFKSLIISSIKDEQEKFTICKQLRADNPYLAAYVIKYFSDEYKLKIIDLETEMEDKYGLSKYISDDNIKLRILAEVKDRYYFCEILKSISDDNTKLQIIEQLIKSPAITILGENVIFPGTELNKDELIGLYSSLRADENILKYFETRPADMDSADIFRYIKDESKKIAALDWSDDLNYKLRIIDYIENSQLRLELFLNLNQFSNIESLINNESRHIRNVPQEVIDYFSEKYQIDKATLSKIYKSFGIEILNNINNPNIREIALLSDSEYQKLETMLNVQGALVFDKKAVDGICEAIIQREFRFEKNDVLDIFAIINQNLNVNNKLVSEQLSKVFESLGPELESLLESSNLNLDSFTQALMNQPSPEIIAVLHQLTTRYIELERQKYLILRQKELDSELNLKKSYEKNYILDKMFSTLDSEEIIAKIQELDEQNLEHAHISLLSNKELLQKCVEFKKNPAAFDLKKEVELKSNLKAFNQILSIYYNQNSNNLDELVQFDQEAKYILEVKTTEKSHLAAILTELNIKLLKEKVFNDEQVFNDLLSILSKYKFVGWQDTFDKLLEKADITFDETTIASLICYFYQFYPLLTKEGNVSLLSIIDSAEMYGSLSSKYNALFDKGNFELYRNNPSPNPSPMKKHERMEAIPELLKQVHQREYITVPPMDEVINFDGKQLRVVFGDVREMDNITLGEKTGSCARLGGAGRTLFEYSLLNENGLNIRFYDVKTGELVSKVLGFRRGNSVFLNELRSSLKPDVFTNEHLEQAIKNIAEKIVDKTKQDEFPIENVMIAKLIAMKNSKLETIDLLEPDYREKTADVYSDIKYSAILLAHSPEKKLPDYSTENVTRYEITKAPKSKTKDRSEIIRKVTKLNLMQGLLNDLEFADIVPPEISKFEAISEIISDDEMYVSFDKEGNILEEFYVDDTITQKKEEEYENQGQSRGI